MKFSLQWTALIGLLKQQVNEKKLFLGHGRHNFYNRINSQEFSSATQNKLIYLQVACSQSTPRGSEWMLIAGEEGVTQGCWVDYHPANRLLHSFGGQDCQWIMRHDISVNDCMFSWSVGSKIGWGICHLHCLSSESAIHHRLMWLVGISTMFRDHWQSLTQVQQQANCLLYGLCKETSNSLAHHCGTPPRLSMQTPSEKGLTDIFS